MGRPADLIQISYTYAALLISVKYLISDFQTVNICLLMLMSIVTYLDYVRMYIVLFSYKAGYIRVKGNFY